MGAIFVTLGDYDMVELIRRWMYCKYHLERVWFNLIDGHWMCECHNREREI